LPVFDILTNGTNPPEVSSSLLHVDFGVLFTQENKVKEETFGISSSSTSREDHETRHKSRHEMNKNPNNPRTEASTRKTPETWMFTNEINSAREIFSQPRTA
jgi:hypothetical protein